MKRFLICTLTLSAGVLLAQKPAASPLRNAIGMDFVKIAPGEFMMGCSKDDKECNPDENPRHRVQITKSFEIGKYEVTQAQWVAIMQTNPSSNKSDTHPVETVSKLEAQDFITKLNAMNDGYRYRLPTEAEWEYAARAGSDSPYSGSLGQVAWYAANSDDETHPVGQKNPNAWGLYDTQGNVREWVSDLYTANYYSNSPVVDPTGPELGARGGRGGPGGGQGPGGPGGRGGRGGQQGGNPPPPFPPGPPPGASQQQQIDALRLQVQQLQQEIQSLRNQLDGGPPRGGPGGPGGLGRGGQGPAVIGPNGTFIDPLDGLPTGLPVVRGGGWDQSGAFQRVSARYSYYGPTLRVSDIGFRVVRQPVAQ
jgi:formylglycine-generating enzyme required for sulfatase activity